MLTAPYNSGLGLPTNGEYSDGPNKPRRKRSVSIPSVGGPPPVTFPAPRTGQTGVAQMNASAPVPPGTIQPELLPPALSTQDLTRDMEREQVSGQPGMPGPLPPMGPVHVGIETRGMSRLGKRLSQIELMKTADPTSRISEDPTWGWEEGPPEQNPSRKKQILMGLLQGALAGGQFGLAGAAGGAAAGGAAGGINPRLMMALKRQQEIDYLERGVANDLELQKGAAQIGSMRSQTEENQARADYYRTQGGTQERTRAIALYRALPHYKRGEDAELDAYFDEVGLPVTDKDSAAGDLVDYTDKQGRTFKVKPEQAARLYQRDNAPPGGGGTALTQDAMAAEGAEELSQATRAEEEIQKEIDALTGDAVRGRESVTKKDALWRAEASKRLREALQNYVQGVDARPTLEQFLDEVRAEDKDYVEGVYGTTVKNTEAKEKRLDDLRKELLGVKKEKRGGSAKSARGAVSKSAKPSATTHSFSLGAYMKDTGADEAAARAYAAKNYPDYKVVP